MIAECLNLPQYRELIRSLPVPTPVQMRQFAAFVAHAHSWYKHLPLLPPGVPMQFFLNPAAGMDLERDIGGAIKVTPREKQGFHYSWIKTADYRARFGYLAFSRSVGTSVSLRLSNGTQLMASDDAPCIFDFITGRMFYVPTEVSTAGRAFVSGAVHTAGADAGLWNFLVFRRRPAPHWPSESGGAEAMEKIRQRCRALSEDPSRRECLSLQDLRPDQNVNILVVDYPLYQLLEPERQRQQTDMVAAMERVIKLTTKDVA
jgi:hypothetical protein